MFEWFKGFAARLRSSAGHRFTPITWESRRMIARYFPVNNADIRSGSSQRPLFDTHVQAEHGMGRMTFFGEDGLLKVSVAWYEVKGDCMGANPVGHTEHIIRSEDDLERLRFELSR